jgi:hypothetical protein
LLQIVSECTNIHGGDVLKPGQPNGRTVYHADFKGYEKEFSDRLLNGKINANYIKSNNINLENCYNFTDSGGGRGPYLYHYPIEWAIINNAPMKSLEVLLKNGTPINGFKDYNLVKGILLSVVKNCGTIKKTFYEKIINKSVWYAEANKKLTLYQQYLELLFQHNINLDEKFPAHNGHGADEPYGTCKPTEYLPKVLESKKKDLFLVVFEDPFNTIQDMLTQQIEFRKTMLSATLPKNNTQPSWLQSKLFKTVVGVGTFAVLFFATRWLYSKCAGTLQLSKLKCAPTSRS